LPAQTRQGLNEAGLSATQFFETSAEAAVAIIAEVRAGDLILVKGSRGVATDQIVDSLRRHFPLLGEKG